MASSHVTHARAYEGGDRITAVNERRVTETPGLLGQACSHGAQQSVEPDANAGMIDTLQDGKRTTVRAKSTGVGLHKEQSMTSSAARALGWLVTAIGGMGRCDTAGPIPGLTKRSGLAGHEHRTDWLTRLTGRPTCCMQRSVTHRAVAAGADGQPRTARRQRTSRAPRRDKERPGDGARAPQLGLTAPGAGCSNQRPGTVGSSAEEPAGPMQPRRQHGNSMEADPDRMDPGVGRHASREPALRAVGEPRAARDDGDTPFSMVDGAARGTGAAAGQKQDGAHTRAEGTAERPP